MSSPGRSSEVRITPRMPSVDNITEIASGFYLIRLPLPFELNHINVGLVRLPDGWMLIDTGLDTQDSFRILQAALASLGVGLRDIRTIFITHVHPDHVGLAARLAPLTGARVLMHAEEAEHLNRIHEDRGAPDFEEGFELAGIPPELQQKIRRSLVSFRQLFRPLVPDSTLTGGEVIETALGPAEIISTPGHAPGHVCLYWRERRLLFAGDHMIEQITPNIAWLPDRDMLGEYLDSLRRMDQLDIDLVVPSHGAPFRDHHRWIAATIAHHEERCQELLRHLNVGHRTAHDLVPELWTRELSPFHYFFAVFEVLAHVEHLQRRGRLARARV